MRLNYTDARRGSKQADLCDAYGAKEWREGEGDDEVALRTERIERRICHAVAEFSFRQAERVGRKGLRRAQVHGEPDLRGHAQGGDGRGRCATRRRALRAELIDATFALLISSSGAPMVIPALNRDSDILSDLVLPLFGSIAGSGSLSSPSATTRPERVDGGGCTGPHPGCRQGRGESHGDDPRGRRSPHAADDKATQMTGRAIREACLETVADGVRTADLGGQPAPAPLPTRSSGVRARRSRVGCA